MNLIIKQGILNGVFYTGDNDIDKQNKISSEPSTCIQEVMVLINK